MHSHICCPRIGVSLDFRNSCSHDEAVRKGQVGVGGQRGTEGREAICGQRLKVWGQVGEGPFWFSLP